MFASKVAASQTKSAGPPKAPIASWSEPWDHLAPSQTAPAPGHFGLLGARGAGLGQLQPGEPALPPDEAVPPVPMDTPAPQQPPAAKPVSGPAITVTNGWASPGGDKNRTTVGVGELTSFIVSDVPGGSWKSADGRGTTLNSVTFTWTAQTAGTNVITYIAADKSVSTVTMTTVLPSTLSGHKDSDITTYAAGQQGSGMALTITVLPNTVSFQALELQEQTCNASAISGYFSTHHPPPHNASAGAGTWNQVGQANDVSDTADSSGWPSPWSSGSYTWAIPAKWRVAGSPTSTRFNATSDEIVTISDTHGTTTVAKLGATSSPRTP